VENTPHSALRPTKTNGSPTRSSEAAERNEKRTTNPRQLEDAKFFRDQLEADLYGYRYSKKHQHWILHKEQPNQDPRSQGGFVPKATKKVANRAASGQGTVSCRRLDDRWPIAELCQTMSLGEKVSQR